MTTSFPELLASLDLPTFFREYWQREVLHVPHAKGVQDLISLADVEFLIASLTSVGPDWMRVVKEGSTLQPGAYCTEESFVSLPKVYDAYNRGYTIQLAKVDKRSLAVGRLCRTAEAAFTAAGVFLSRRIGSHLYLTPANSAGFNPHYDNHDVMVVQVQGAKRWKVYGSLERFPAGMQKGVVPREQLPELRYDICLEAGQVLYIPRGIFHEALAEDRHSLHVTLDIFPVTWADLVSRVVAADAAFREALPPGSWGTHGSSGMLQEGFRARVTALLESDDVRHMTTKMLEGFLDRLDTLPDQGLSQLHLIEAVTLDTVVERRPGAFPCVFNTAQRLRLRFPGSGLSAPRELEPVFQFLSTEHSFSVDDLPNTLSSEGKVELARELIREGLLAVAAPA